MSEGAGGGGLCHPYVYACMGWNSQAHRESPEQFESSNLSRDNIRVGVVVVVSLMAMHRIYILVL